LIRTQIQLSEEDYEKLKVIAVRQKKSMAECIREGIQLFLLGVPSGGTDLESLAGSFRPLGSNDLKPHDAQWACAIREDVEPRRVRKKK
jgi:hypothetical protein